MSSEKVIMNGGLCTVVEERVLFQCTTEDLLDQYRAKIPIKTRLMPTNTVYYERREDMRSVYIIGYTPRLMRIKYKNSDNNVDVYRISMPFLYYVVKCHEAKNFTNYIYPCCTLKPIQSMKDPIFAAPIPNIHNGGHSNMCTGEIRCDVSWDLTRKINHIMNEMYSSTWNNDLNFSHPKGIKSFKDWNDKSLKDGLLWNTLEYSKHNKSNFEGLINFVFSHGVD